MTYTSIHVLALQRSADGEIARWKSGFGEQAQLRTLLVSREVEDYLQANHSSSQRASRAFALRADFAVFTEGRRVQVAEDSTQSGTAYMARLYDHSHQVWEIRSRDPDPSLRVFGAFMEQDTFVALTVRERAFLDRFGSLMWADAIRQTKAKWRRLFEPYDPIVRKCVDDYISSGGILVRGAKRRSASDPRGKACLL